MKSLGQEIHQRSIWQVATLYAGFSWLVIQISQTLTEGLGLPDWVVPFALILLAIGLPIVLVTAFLQKGMRTRVAVPAAQSLADVGEVDPGPPVPVTGAARTWTWRRAMLGGASAFALFVLVAFAWTLMRSMGIGPAGSLVARGVLEERDVILLADFENATGDATLGRVVTEALRVDLSQSDAVRLADGGFIDDALRRMQRPSDAVLVEDLALEIGRREGLKAILVGDVARAGSGYLLTASLVAPETEEILVSHRETAPNDDALLDAIDGLSRRLRERIGEPLASLAGSPGLEQVTTANLDALRSFTEGHRLPQSEAQRRIALFDQATRQDSTFAMAWNALGIALANYGVEPGRAMEARTRAFELRENLPEHEKNQAVTIYYLGVTREPRQAIPYLEAMIEGETDPSGAMNNLGEAYRDLGDLEAALEHYHRSIVADSMTGTPTSIPFMNLAQMSVTMGDFEAARRYAEDLERFEGPFAEWHRGFASAGARDYETAERQFRTATEMVTGSPFLLSQTTQGLATVLAIRGRRSESDEFWELATTTQDQNASPVEALRNMVAAAVLEAAATGEDTSPRLDSALARFPMADMDPVTRPYLDVAEAWASVGRAEEAKAMLAQFETSTPPNFQHGLRHHYHRVLGQIALIEDRPDEAISEFKLSAPRPQELEWMVLLGNAFDAAGQADSARVYLGRFLDSAHWLGIIPHARFLANALVRKAELEYEAGDLEAAARYYAEFVELWAGADPELQPRVRAAQARLQEIYDQIG